MAEDEDRPRRRLTLLQVVVLRRAKLVGPDAKRPRQVAVAVVTVVAVGGALFALLSSGSSSDNGAPTGALTGDVQVKGCTADEVQVTALDLSNSTTTPSTTTTAPPASTTTLSTPTTSSTSTSTSALRR